MPRLKFTVVLIPDDDGYQVVVPHYSECTTWGKTPTEAFANAKEALELILERYAEKRPNDTVPHNVQAVHVVVGDVEIEVPEILISNEEQTSKDERSVPT